MKLFKLQLILFFLIISSSARTQCAYDNTITGAPISLACPASSTVTIDGGQSVVINVTNGLEYTFSTCGGSGCDTQLTLFTSGGGTNLGYSDDFCGLQSEITWTATFTGQVDLLLDQFNCSDGCPGTIVTISCTGPPVVPPNDDPCGAINLPVGTTCTATTVIINSLTTATAGIPAPGCGSYNGGDVWYSFVVPANGLVTLATETGTITDAAMAVYSAPSCGGAMTLINCDDNGNISMPSLNLTGLTPGETIYVRLWDFGGDNYGNFTLCAIEGCSGSANSTCNAADGFCTGAAVNFCNTTGVASMGAYDCLGSTPNPAWFYLNIGSSGNIDIFMSQTNNNGVGIDVDFALYGPYTSVAAGCADIGPGTVTVDCSYSGAPTETASIPNGIAGEFYILLITNFSDQPGQVNYSQVAGSGTTDCAVLNPCSSSAVPTNFQCNGVGTGSILVTATGGTTDFNVSWTGTTSGDPAGPEITTIGGTFNMTNLPAGSYDITVTDGDACISSHTVTIIEPAILQASESHVDPICFGNNVTATITATGGTAPYNVSWTGPSNGNPAGNEINVSGGTYNMTGLGIGTYNVTVTDASGCTATTTVDIVSATAINITTNVTDALCAGVNTGAIDVTVSGGATPYEVSWTGPSSGNPAGSEIIVSGGTYTIAGLSGGNYDVTVSDGNACSGTLPISIVSPTTLNLTLDKTDISCNGFSDGQINTSVSGGTTPYTYTWDNGSTTANISNLVAGNYCLTLTDGNGCSANDCEAISEPTVLTLTLTTTDVTCNGICDGTATSVVGGGTPPYSYNWSGLAGNNSTSASSICDGTYDLIVADAEGCSIDTLDWIISEPIALTMTVATVDETCFGICDGSITIVSNTGVSFSINGGTTFSANTVYPDLCSGIYNVIAEDPNGCRVNSNQTISGPPEVEAYFTFGPQPANILNPTIIFENHSMGAVSYLWDFGFAQSSDVNPIVDFPDDSAGTYNVCLYAYNSVNCPDSICYDVSIDEDFAIYVPNSFTPNGDGMNDVFYVYGNDIDPEFYQLMVFNRWGELIFETSDMNEGWDGTEGGLSVPIGIYIWRLKTEAKSQEKYFDKIGQVNLVR